MGCRDSHVTLAAPDRSYQQAPDQPGLRLLLACLNADPAPAAPPPKRAAGRLRWGR